MKSIYLPIVPIVFCCFLLASCVANKQYRHGASEDALKTEQGVHPIGGVFVNVIELDEHGEFWDRKQLDFALGTIFANQDPDNGEIVITFVHGWKNNASPENAKPGGNLHDFVELLNGLEKKEQTIHGARARKIVGVYLAWRGSSISTPVLKELTFYSRMNAATRIANSPAATEALLYVLGVAHDNPKTKSIVVGHSYGGLLVEKALSQALVETAITQGIFKKRDPKSVHRITPVPFPADLVVLVNPAAPGIYARELSAALEAAHYESGFLNPSYVCGRERDPKPVIVSVTSEGDWGTGIFFPLGNHITSVFQRFDQPTVDKKDADYPPVLKGQRSQRYYYTHTEGHIDELFTHKVDHTHRSEKDACKVGQACACAADVPCTLDPKVPERICYEVGGSRFVLTPNPRATIDPRSAYWIMPIPTSIVADHTTIFVDPFVDMLSGLIDATNATSTE